MSTELTTLSGATMGTHYAAVIRSDAEVDFKALKAELHEAVTRVDMQMSPWIASSFVNQFNALNVGIWMDVPFETAEVIAVALEVEQKSRGAFSIAVAPQVAHTGFSAAEKGVGEAPPMGALAGEALVIDAGRIRKSKPIQIDLCGIAKGYGVDRLAQTLLAHEVTDFMVSIDGEIRSHGAPALGQVWQVALEHPNTQRREARLILPCENVSLATSGGYRNYRQEGGTAVTHTVIPGTGQTVTSIDTSVTVAMKTCCEADAWATAALVSIELGGQLFEEADVNALILKSGSCENSSKGTGIFANA